MATVAQDIFYTSDSLALRDKVQAMITDRLRKLVISRARSEGRDLITRDDFKACFHQAVEEAFAELHIEQP